MSEAFGVELNENESVGSSRRAAEKPLPNSWLQLRHGRSAASLSSVWQK